jgi:hypothetical protein
VTYSTCLLPVLSDAGAIDTFTGATATYTIPGDCLNEKVVKFEKVPDLPQVCADVASLVSAATTTSSTTAPVASNTTDASSSDKPAGSATEQPAESKPDQALRGRRRMESETAGSGFDVTYLFMIDIEEESDQPGTTFFSSKAAENQPSLTIKGENTCETAGTFRLL